MQRVTCSCLLLLAIAAAGAVQAEIIIDSIVRETSATITWTEDAGYHFEDGERLDDLVAPGMGAAHLAAAVGAMGGAVTATQDTDVLIGGGPTIVTGEFAFSAANEAGVESLQLGGFNRMAMAFRADPGLQFMVSHADAEGPMVVRLRDASSGEALLEIDSQWVDDIAIRTLGGSGAYVFEVIADMDFAPGLDTTAHAGSASFNLVFLDGSVDGDPATLSDLKALYR